MRLRAQIEATEVKLRESAALAEAEHARAAERVQMLERRIAGLGAEAAARQARNKALRERLKTRGDALETVYFRRPRELGRRLRIRLAKTRYWLWERNLMRLLPSKLRRRIEAAAVANAPLFEPKWYARKNLSKRGGASKSRKACAEHFATVGWRRGMRPGRQFDTRWYLAQHPELAARGLNPLVHFLKGGALTGARPKPKVNVAGYLESNLSALVRPVTMVEIVAWEKRRTAERSAAEPKPPTA